MDYSKLTDEELTKMYNETVQNEPDYSSLSDEDLKDLYNKTVLQGSIKPQSQPQSNESQVLTGEVQQNIRQELDKKGRVHFIDADTGEEIKSNLSPLQKVGRKLKATSENIRSFMTQDYGEPLKARQKAGAMVLSSLLPAGQGIGAMALSGALGSGLYSGAEQFVDEGKIKPSKLAIDTALGGALGGTFGLGGKYIGNQIAKTQRNKLFKNLKNKGEQVDTPKDEYNINKELTSKPVKETGNIAPEGEKPVGLVQSVINKSDAPKEAKAILKENNLTYIPQSNEEAIKKAKQIADNDFENQVTRLASGEKFEDIDYAIAQEVTKKLFGENKYKQAVDIIENIGKDATKKGREIQLLSLWNNLTPEGAVYRTEKLIEQYNKKYNKNLKLSEDKAKEISEAQKMAQSLEEGYDKQVALAKAAKIGTDLIPKSKLTKLKAYRNISMLLNPKTLERNILGNAIFGVTDIAAKTLAAPIDALIGLGTKRRTRVLPQIKNMVEGMRTGAKRGLSEAGQGIDTKGLGQRYDLMQGNTFNSPFLGNAEKLLNISLKVPDRLQYEGVFTESVANQIKANRNKLNKLQIQTLNDKGLLPKEVSELISKNKKIPLKKAQNLLNKSGLTPEQIRTLIDTRVIDDKVLRQADYEALESVFQNNSKLSNAILDLRRGMNRFVGTEDFGLGDLFIPYAQTPANLAQQAINYSPLGMIKSVSNFRQGNQRQASLDLARALLGTGISGGAYLGAKNGLISPTQYDENYLKNKQLKENMRLLGQQPEAINGVWYAPFQPLSTNVSVGSAIASGENPTQAGLNTLLDLPFLQNTNRFINDTRNKGLTQAGLNFVSSVPSQFIPTLAGQFAQYIYPENRETYSPDVIKQGLNVAQQKIPLPYIGRGTLPVKRNVKGETYSNYSDNSIGNIFLNPTFYNKPIDDPVIQEMVNLQEMTKTSTKKQGKTSQYLPIPDKKFIKDTKMNNVYLSEYERVLGETMYDYIQDLMQTEDYKNADAENRIKMIKKIKTSVNKSVKEYMIDYMKNN